MRLRDLVKSSKPRFAVYVKYIIITFLRTTLSIQVDKTYELLYSWLANKSAGSDLLISCSLAASLNGFHIVFWTLRVEGAAKWINFRHNFQIIVQSIMKKCGKLTLWWWHRGEEPRPVWVSDPTRRPGMKRAFYHCRASPPRRLRLAKNYCKNTTRLCQSIKAWYIG